MITIGSILRAKTGNSVAVVSLYSRYNITAKTINIPLFNQSDFVKAIPNDQLFGIVQEIDTVNNVALVMLSIQVFDKAGRQITHAFCELSKCEVLEAIIANGQRYFANNDVNIRNASGVASTIRTVAKKGDYIGFSDGVKDRNGFCRFQLAIGGIGYVSAKYISTSKPARKITDTGEPQATAVYSKNLKIGLGVATALAIGGFFYQKVKKN
jgi:hypothetical protein